MEKSMSNGDDNKNIAINHLKMKLKEHQEAIAFAQTFYEDRKKSEPEMVDYYEQLKKRAISYHQKEIDKIEHKLENI
ncbi:MAG: hypothetical protein O6943_11980 [Bacteroidetes bacterium]|nr:hypothetical protein [Bacteroidota bacterium]